MATTKSGQKAVNKYINNNYDRVNLTMPKGKKDTIKQAASKMGESLSEYINKAIDKRLEEQE